MYEQSIVPMHWPGGGSFSVTQYSLDALYDMHNRCRNWWTGSNEDLPLCRYLGCKLTLYQCQYTDYVLKVETELPSNSNKLTYPSTHPSIMLMSNKKHIIRSKQNLKKRKPYTKIWIPPPPQLQTKWYFQVDLYKTPLLQIHASACNLNNPYLKPQNKSDNITFWTINTTSIQNREISVETDTSWPFKKIGTFSYYMYYYTPGPLPNDTKTIKVTSLIPLTNPRNYYAGQAYDELIHKPSINDYYTNFKQYWGNIFHPDLEHIESFAFSRKSPEAIAQKMKQLNNANTTWNQLDESAEMVLTPFNEPIFIPMQYNPNKDTGQDTKIYLLSNRQGHGWDPPGIPELELDGFPMWLGLWGYTDFQKRLKKVTNIDTEYILVIKTHFTQKPNNVPLVIIDEGFTKGHSPYETTVLTEDTTKWYPMYQYQTLEQNKILQTGPFTPNILDYQSDNITIFYKFYFKWGGSPPKNINVENPAHQIQYPIPRNEYETTSLQNPGQAPESILYSFDQRHGNITTTALSRITKDWPIKETLFTITDEQRQQQLLQAIQDLKATEDTQQEKEKEIQQLIQQLQQQQQQYRQRIADLLTNNNQ